MMEFEFYLNWYYFAVFSSPYSDDSIDTRNRAGSPEV